MLTKLEK